MSELWKKLLPDWAQPDHAILQYELAQRRFAGSRWNSALQLVLFSLLLGGGAFLYASAAAIDAGASNLFDLLWQCLYFPSLALQTATVLASLALGLRVVEADRSRQTWDSLRATEFGVGMTLRARWLGILYRLRAPIVALLLARLVAVIGMTLDISAFGGGYLLALGSGNIALGLSLLVVILLMTAHLLLPIATVGLASALGILISVTIKQGLFAVLMQLVLSAAFVLMVAGGALVVTSAVQGQLLASDQLLFSVILAYSAFIDGAMRLANLGSLGELWQLLPQLPFLSIGLLLLLALQACLIDGCLGLAIRRSERGE